MRSGFIRRRLPLPLFVWAGLLVMSGAEAAPTPAPYGSWSSPITSDAIVADSLKLGQVAIDGDDIYWVEGRPAEGGRNVLMRRRADGAIDEMTPPAFNVRSRAHEYGGGSFTVTGHIAYFSNFQDQALYLQPPDGPPQALVAEPGARFADAVVDAPRSRLIAVRELHAGDASEPFTSLVAIGLEGEHTIRVLAEGADFYSSPALSPDGRELAWLSWSHPNMPWDGTTLRVGRFDDDGFLVDIRVVAGAADESIFQPQWSPDGELVFASDRSGWWNLYGWRAGKVRLIHKSASEFGEPQWEFGMSRRGFTADGRIVASDIADGIASLAADACLPDVGARSIAARAEEYMKSTGIADGALFGPENEFFIFDSVRFDSGLKGCFVEIDAENAAWNSGKAYEHGNTGHRPGVKGGYFPVPPVDALQDIRSAMCTTLEEIGITTEVHHHEVATGGQCEIGVKFGTLVQKADEVLRLKYVVQNVAHQFGKTATFMPKPIVGDNGSGMHVHQSLWKDGKPLFHDESGYAGLSDIARHYIGGILHHAPSLLAFTNPTVNSYKRLVPGYEAPINLVYSQRNRSACVRIPITGNNPKAKRLEFRCPDSSGNPYLAFAAMLMAGIDGIGAVITISPTSSMSGCRAGDQLCRATPR